VQYSTAQHSAEQYSTIQRSTVLYSCSTQEARSTHLAVGLAGGLSLQDSTIQDSTIQHNTVQHITAAVQIAHRRPGRSFILQLDLQAAMALRGRWRAHTTVQYSSDATATVAAHRRPGHKSRLRLTLQLDWQAARDPEGALAGAHTDAQLLG